MSQQTIGSTFQTISHDIDDGVLTVTLDRPDNLNAFTSQMAEELEQTFRAVNDADEVRAVIVTGNGRAFCAGMDLSGSGNVFGLDESMDPSFADLADPTDPAVTGSRDPGGRLTLSIYDCRKPVIAAINGAAVGIGATMTLAMDARLVSTKARFGLVFGKLGIAQEALSSWFLPRLVGMDRALDLVLSAEILDADQIVAAGLSPETVEPDELLSRARELADRWTRGRSQVAVALSRQLLRRSAGYQHPMQTHQVESLALFHTSVGDGTEGVAAFTDKREPDFQGRASQMPAFYDEWINQDR